MTIHTGDCVDVMAGMDAASFDAIVTDPPYGLEFMGKEWDRLGDVGRASHQGFEATDFKGFTLASYNASANVKCRTCNRWKWDHEGRKCECETPDFANVKADQSRRMENWHRRWATEAFRVAKPGAHLLAFGGTRTYHRLTCALEDAGWEIRDCLVWCYASGFPKSLAPYRSIISGLCPKLESVPHAARVSAFHPLGLPGEKVPTAVGLAETLPEGELVLLIRTGAADDSPVGMAMWPSALGMTTPSSIEWSRNGYSADRWHQESTSIIATAISRITDPTTSKSYLSLPTRIATPLAVSRPDGCECRALPAVKSLTDASANTAGILLASVHEIATAPIAPLRGLGTALKPSHEPIVLARKPLSGTVLGNLTRYGTGALNIDGTRIGTADDLGGGYGEMYRLNGENRRPWMDDPDHIRRTQPPSAGRWPPNLLLTDAELFDVRNDGVVGSGAVADSAASGTWGRRWDGDDSYRLDGANDVKYGDTGGYARFFLVPKASRSDREPVWGEELAEGANADWPQSLDGNDARGAKPRRNTHPTTKPVDLMRHLVRLVTPPGGRILDPFLGSGTTAIAAIMEGFECVGIEREPEYVAIAEARLNGVQTGIGL